MKTRVRIRLIVTSERGAPPTAPGESPRTRALRGGRGGTLWITLCAHRHTSYKEAGGCPDTPGPRCARWEAATIQAIRRAAPSELNGDDAAILRPTAPNSRHVSCTDILVLGRHFRPEYSTAYEVGVKAITQNFADIQAMGARPTAALLGLAIPGDTPLSWVSELAEGIGATAEPWAAELVGGDIVQGKELLISITALGELTGPAPALRVNRTAPGQQVIVHGKLGHSAAGLDILRHYGSRAAIPDDEILQELATWHCAPTLVAGRGPSPGPPGLPV